MKMPASWLECSDGFCLVLFLPFGDDVIVCAHVEKSLEQEREGMRGRLFER